MEVKSIAECSNGSIQQYFRPSLSYHLSLRSLFCLFLSVAVLHKRYCTCVSKKTDTCILLEPKYKRCRFSRQLKLTSSLNLFSSMWSSWRFHWLINELSLIFLILFRSRTNSLRSWRLSMPSTFCISLPAMIGRAWIAHGRKFKILNFWNSNFKTCRVPTKMDNLKLKWLIVFR